MIEVEEPLEGFKDLIERIIKANTKNQQQVALLQTKKDEAWWQYNIASTMIHRINEQLSTVIVTQYNNLKGFWKKVDGIAKQATFLNSVVSEWLNHFVSAFNKCKIQKEEVTDNNRQNKESQLPHINKDTKTRSLTINQCMVQF